MGLQAGWVEMKVGWVERKAEWVGLQSGYHILQSWCVVCPPDTQSVACMQCMEAELTEDYRRERDQLRSELMEGIVPKEKNGRSSDPPLALRCFNPFTFSLPVPTLPLGVPPGRPITGPELASLLEILVEAANEGLMAQVRVMAAPTLH